MNTHLVVGGGVSGCLAAALFQNKQTPWIGIEKEAELGGRLWPIAYRAHNESTIKWLSELLGAQDLVKEAVTEEAVLRVKGDWVALEQKQKWKDFDLSTGEQNLIRTPHFSINTTQIKLILEPKVVSGFQKNKSVTGIFAKEKKVVCQDGSEFTYDKLLWCSPYDGLKKAYQGDRSKLLYIDTDEARRPGFLVSFHSKEPLFPFAKPILFNFRFKDHRLTAFGNLQSSDNSGNNYWLVTLENKIFDDHEEVAKSVRTFRREWEKEFPELAPNVTCDKIVFLPSLVREPLAEVKSLEVAPDIFYLGPELKLEDSSKENSEFDVIINNLTHFSLHN